MQEQPFSMNRSLKAYNHIFKEINTIYQNAALKLGLSNSAFDIYYAICELGDGCRQKDIVDSTFLPKQTVHSTIHQMEKDGLITLRAGKGRSMNIYLTPLGRDKVYRAMLPVIECENHAFETMTPEDASILLDSSTHYIEHLQDAFANFLNTEVTQ